MQLCLALAIAGAALLLSTASDFSGWTDVEWSEGKVKSSNPDLGNQDLYIAEPMFTHEVGLDQEILPREHEVKCWTCYTLDTLKVSTENCNRTLCTGKQISACYKWHVKYGFKKYRTYRGCMDNYTEIDYTNAMCRGTGLPLNETCSWDLCKTDYCNSSYIKQISYALIILLAVYWNTQNGQQWPTLV